MNVNNGINSQKIYCIIKLYILLIYTIVHIHLVAFTTIESTGKLIETDRNNTLNLHW